MTGRRFKTRHFCFESPDFRFVPHGHRFRSLRFRFRPHHLRFRRHPQRHVRDRAFDRSTGLATTIVGMAGRKYRIIPHEPQRHPRCAKPSAGCVQSPANCQHFETRCGQIDRHHLNLPSRDSRHGICDSPLENVDCSGGWCRATGARVPPRVAITTSGNHHLGYALLERF